MKRLCFAHVGPCLQLRTCACDTSLTCGREKVRVNAVGPGCLPVSPDDGLWDKQLESREVEDEEKVEEEKGLCWQMRNLPPPLSYSKVKLFDRRGLRAELRLRASSPGCNLKRSAEPEISNFITQMCNLLNQV